MLKIIVLSVLALTLSGCILVPVGHDHDHDHDHDGDRHLSMQFSNGAPSIAVSAGSVARLS